MSRTSSSSQPSPSKRTAPEWITFGVSAAIVLLVVGALVVLSFQSSDAAQPVAGRPGIARNVDGRFFVSVDVVNRGDEGAAEIQVSAELTVDGQTTSGDQVVDFLGGGESQTLTFAFDADPSRGDLIVAVTGFSDP